MFLKYFIKQYVWSFCLGSLPLMLQSRTPIHRGKQTNCNQTGKLSTTMRMAAETNSASGCLSYPANTRDPSAANTGVSCDKEQR